ncbi:type I secretion system permease/ATPase [Sphingomonas cavernae]|uniref:Type I secretion system permease/ATPase n=1 Tax=Sphingomonas cavernae TaxID=2320861 RepID=A0A418WLS8_9SPHN|nr:type I secretion system permease/ATPase [Sphingomonas cavernae]RJF90859.1 type I secretion system permease/ATPase [Sphingomonas cavernae]
MRLILGRNLPRALREALDACREHLLLAAGLSALINLLYLAPTLYMMQVYDRVVPTSGTLTLFWITLVVAFALVTLAVLDNIRSRILIRASLRVERALAEHILDCQLAAQPSTEDRQANMQAMREFDALRQFIGGAGLAVIFDIPWLPIFVLVAFLLHPLLGALILVGGALLAGITWFNERATRERLREGLLATAQFHAAQDRISARSETVRALGMRRALVKRQLGLRSRGLSMSVAAQFDGGRYTAAAKFLRLLLQSLALGMAAWLAVEREISVGAIIAGSVLLSRALQPVEQLVAAWPSIAQARQAVVTLGQLFARSQTSDTARTMLPRPAGRIDVQRLFVSAPQGDALLLKDVSFVSAPGQVIGVIGPSGAGKTTLARVLAGAVRPDGGNVRFDGASMQDWDPEVLAAHIGYLPQDYLLFAGTVAENISRFAAASGASAKTVSNEVIAAAKMAGAHDMILALPGGYDAYVGFDGEGLSAGQRQRIALARALYGDPSIVILDEPNAALDAEGEAALARAIQTLRNRGATVVIVAHRAGILSVADWLLVLARGTVERYGPRSDVLAALAARSERSNVVTMTSGQH